MAKPNHHREPLQPYRNQIEERIAGLRSRQAALEQLINSLTEYAQCGRQEFDLKYAWHPAEHSGRTPAKRPRGQYGYPR